MFPIIHISKEWAKLLSVSQQKCTFPAFVFLMSTGIMCNFKQVCSQPELIQRKADQAPEEATKLEEDIQEVINKIHSLSSENKNTRRFTSAAESFDLNTYYSTLSNLYTLAQSLLREKYIDNLPRTLVCILSGRQDCGPEAELTKTVSLDLLKPLLAFVSSLRSHTCTQRQSNNLLLTAYLRMGESTTAAFSSFQHSLMNTLSSFPLSGSLMGALSGLVDATVTNVLKFLAMLLQGPIDYMKIALQFGIRIPSLDEKETCEQGKTLFFHPLKIGLTFM